MDCNTNASQTGAPVGAPSYSVSPTNGGYDGSPNGAPRPAYLAERNDFDVFAWHEAHKSCLKYFLDKSQHEAMVQAVAALINIRLPFQWARNPVPRFYIQSNQPSLHGRQQQYGYRSAPGPEQAPPGHAFWVSLLPFIRRLVATGFDTDGILHGFFGDDWRRGVGELQELERRNFLFTAKSVGWAKVKYQYDMPPDELIPFIKPLQNVKIEEIESAEKNWSKWLAMEDWMVGPRDPDVETAAEMRGNQL
jgi:hypothetical protein